MTMRAAEINEGRRVVTTETAGAVERMRWKYIQVSMYYYHYTGCINDGGSVCSVRRRRRRLLLLLLAV